MTCCGQYATPGSGDSILLKKSGNEVCDIINCVVIKGARGNALIPSEREVPSTGFKETEVAQSFQRNCQVCLLLKPYFVVDFLELLRPFIVVHMYSRRVPGESGLIWRNFHALCAML